MNLISNILHQKQTTNLIFKDTSRNMIVFRTEKTNQSDI